MCICFDIVKDRYFDWFVCLYYLLIYYFIDFWICMCAHFYVHAMCMILYVYVQKDAKSISRDWFYIYIISLSIRNGPPRRNSSFTSNECSFTPTVVLYQCKSIDYMHMMSHFMCRRRFHKLNWIRLEGLPHWGCPPPQKKKLPATSQESTTYHLLCRRLKLPQLSSVEMEIEVRHFARWAYWCVWIASTDFVHLVSGCHLKRTHKVANDTAGQRNAGCFCCLVIHSGLDWFTHCVMSNVLGQYLARISYV